MASHLHAFQDVSGRASCADRTWRPVSVGLPMRFRAAMETVPLDNSSETTSFGQSGGVDYITFSEESGIHRLAYFYFGQVICIYFP
jgi:hypothetical protein